MKSDIKKAAHILKSGGVVIFPTDTVWGIGCRADDKKSVERIYKIKGTPKNQPFPILVSKISQIKKIAKVTPQAVELIKKYWPGGLTLILKTKDQKDKIGFRMPDSKLLLQIIDQVGPIIGTSANFHTKPPPKTFAGLDPSLTKLVDLIIEGRTTKGIESTVVDATLDPPKIIRQGVISLHQFESV